MIKNKENYEQCGAYRLLFKNFCYDCTHRNTCTKKKISPLFETIIELIQYIEECTTDEYSDCSRFAAWKSEDFQALIDNAKKKLNEAYLK